MENNKVHQKKNKVGVYTLTNFKIYDKAIVTKTVWDGCKNRHRSVEQN